MPCDRWKRWLRHARHVSRPRAANTRSAASARDVIRDAARRSVAKIGSIKPYTVSGPVTLQIEYTTRNSLPVDAESRTGAEVLDDRAHRKEDRDGEQNGLDNLPDQ